MILDSANVGAAKTKIMYKVFVSYHQLIGYLAVLIENWTQWIYHRNQNIHDYRKRLNISENAHEIMELLHITTKANK